MKNSILAVIVSFNGGEDTVVTVNSLIEQVGHIYVIDNASYKSSLDFLMAFEDSKAVSIVRLNSNKGIGYALNLGVKKAKALGYKWILTMDQDSVPDKEMISKYADALNTRPYMVCLSPNISVYGKSIFSKGLKKQHDTSPIKYAITSGNLVRVDMFDVIGMYNEAFFIDCIDFDFCLRLREAGYCIHLVKNANMVHKIGEDKAVPKAFSWFYTSHPPSRRYYMYRNFMYVFTSYVFKFPLFVLKSTFIHILLLLVVPFFDKEPFVSITHIYWGIRDYFKGIRGPFKELL